MGQKPSMYSQFALSALIYKQKCCQICFKKHNQAKMVLCDRCQDAFHIKCINLNAVPKDTWICSKCHQDQIIAKQNLMMRKKLNCSDKFQECYKCKEKISHTFQLEYQKQKVVFEAREVSFVNCASCLHQFHNLCFSERTNSINCSECQSEIRLSIPKGHRYFLQFLKNSQDKIAELGYNQITKDFQDQECADYALPQLHLLPPPRITDWRFLICYQASLCYALFTRKMIYSENLVMQMDNEKFNKIVQAHKNSIQFLYRLHKSDEHAYELYKQRLELGYLPPLEVKEDRLKGFYLISTSFIHMNTIIAQYTGEILTARESLNMVNNDNIFALIRNARSVESLDIAPSKFANIAIFISGINNSQKDAEIKQNVRALKFCYKGMCRVIFCALKDIKPSETLYLNYNGDRAACEYPTNNFVH